MKGEIKEEIDNSKGIHPKAKTVAKELVDIDVGTFGLRGYEDAGSVVDSTKRMSNKLKVWNMTSFSDDALLYAVFHGNDWALTWSETKALSYIYDHMLIDENTVKRRETPDFIAEETVGIEVKSNENYSISRKQLLKASGMQVFYIILSTKNRVDILDRIDFLGMNTRPDDWQQ